VNRINHLRKTTLATGIGLAALIASPASADVLEVQVDQVVSWAEQGNPSNWVGALFVGEDMQITGFGYDLTLTTFGDSWLSEAAIWIGDAAVPDQSFTITPGAGMNVPGADVEFDSGGIIPVSLIGLDPVVLSGDTVRFEAFETFTDLPSSADAVWTGSIFIEVAPIPAPGALAVLGLAVGMTGRRRRMAA